MAVIEKVERWRKNLPVNVANLPSCYSSLPSSPTQVQVYTFLCFKLNGRLYIYPQTTYLLICPHNAFESHLKLFPGFRLASIMLVLFHEVWKSSLAQFDSSQNIYDKTVSFFANIPLYKKLLKNRHFRSPWHLVTINLIIYLNFYLF